MVRYFFHVFALDVYIAIQVLVSGYPRCPNHVARLHGHTSSSFRVCS